MRAHGSVLQVQVVFRWMRINSWAPQAPPPLKSHPLSSRSEYWLRTQNSVDCACGASSAPLSSAPRSIGWKCHICRPSLRALICIFCPVRDTSATPGIKPIAFRSEPHCCHRSCSRSCMLATKQRNCREEKMCRDLFLHCRFSLHLINSAERIHDLHHGGRTEC